MRETAIISTSGLKSDATIVFLDPDFLEDAKICDSRTFKADIGLLIFARIFRTCSWLKMRASGAKWGKRWCDVDPSKLVYTFGGSYVCAKFGENRSRNATVRVLTVGYTQHNE